MNNSVKIQINSLEALERLIGGDSTMELEIRQSVVESFSKKHLKSLANEIIDAKIRPMVAQEVTTQFMNKTGTGWTAGYKLTGTIKDQVFECVKEQTQQLITDIVKEELRRQNITETINATLSKQVVYIEKELSEAIVGSKLNDMVNVRIKQAMGLK